jgi:hypothetical protein
MVVFFCFFSIDLDLIFEVISTFQFIGVMVHGFQLAFYDDCGFPHQVFIFCRFMTASCSFVTLKFIEDFTKKTTRTVFFNDSSQVLHFKLYLLHVLDVVPSGQMETISC